jgi:hypothetical protein
MALTSSAQATVVLAAESGGVSKWVVGVGILVSLAVVMLVLLAFGAGREHS